MDYRTEDVNPNHGPSIAGTEHKSGFSLEKKTGMQQDLSKALRLSEYS